MGARSTGDFKVHLPSDGLDRNGSAACSSGHSVTARA